ncbi:MAG: DUF3592 domain-containing protein [Alphaproteobacteria bacterium]|nr:DUF3592 domain-containing protein [Alphaproteobacteria bacterium]
MFDLAFDAMSSFHQAGFLLGAGVCLLLGGALFGNAVYWRTKAQRVEGTIIGIRKKGQYHYNVYSYIMPTTGETVEATASSGSTSLNGRETGRMVELMVFPDRPDDVNASGSYILSIIGLFLLGMGAVFGGIALKDGGIPPMTWGVMAVFALFIGLKIKSAVKPRDQWEHKDAFRARMAEKRQKKWDNIPIQTLESLSTSPTGKKLRAQEKKNRRIAIPILFLLTLGLGGGGVYMGQKMYTLETQGLRADGVVTGLKSQSGSEGGTVYYALAKFKDTEGRVYKFKDHIGSSSPLNKRGDDVTVLYLIEDPKETAIIDRGIWNWAISGGLLLFALFCFLGLMSMLRQKRRDETV